MQKHNDEQLDLVKLDYIRKFLTEVGGCTVKYNNSKWFDVRERLRTIEFEENVTCMDKVSSCVGPIADS